jgi:diguanylate cyclase (GGDEF)-like protein
MSVSAREVGNSPSAAAPSARRFRSIRSLLLVGTLIYAAGGLVDWFVFESARPKVLAVRAVATALMLAVWWLSSFYRSSNGMAVLVVIGILVVGAAQSLQIWFAPAMALATLPTFVLVVVITGPLWSRGCYQLAGMLACTAPPLAMLAVIQAQPSVWASFVGYLGVAMAVALTLWRMRLRAARDSASLRAELERQAVSDALTGVLNRGGWYTHATAALIAAEAQGVSAGLIYFDLDNFKEVNDRYGHAVGDEVIERTASVIRAQLRAQDLLARLGGEEFVALLPRAHLAEARSVAERVRETCRGLPALRGRTISAGIAERRPGETLAVLMARADTALLHAKASGRDRVMAAAPIDTCS